MKTQVIYILSGLVGGMLIMWGIVSFLTDTNVGTLRNTTQRIAANEDSFDAHFIEQMVPHHEDAITMATLAQQRAIRPELQEMAQNIIDSQGKENEQMEKWYRAWFGKELPTGEAVMERHSMMESETEMHMGMMGDATDLTRIEEAEDFDIAFVEHMIPHHQMAIMMASMLKEGTERPEMKQLADDIITAQTDEIDQMRQWLQEWH